MRGGTKDDELMPETPNFDGSGPPSPGGIGLGMPGSAPFPVGLPAHLASTAPR